MKNRITLLLLVGCALIASRSMAGSVRLAAASSLQFALNDVITAFRAEQPGDFVEAVYGASGKLTTQIRNGLPVDLFFAADMAHPARLAETEWSDGPPEVFVFGHLVLYSLDKTPMVLSDLATPGVRTIAVANPRLAPYGARAEEALQFVGLLDVCSNKLVYGENIAQAAHFVVSGAADAGLIALSLVKSGMLTELGTWTMIDPASHAPLEQGMVRSKTSSENEAVTRFLAFLHTMPAVTILERYGFTVPVPAPAGKE